MEKRLFAVRPGQNPLTELTQAGSIICMNDASLSPTSRRAFLKNTTRLAAVSALAGVTVPNVHASGSDTIQVALIGCGGRGTGAAGDALSTKSGPIKLVAMADVFEDRLSSSFEPAQDQIRRAGRSPRGSQIHRV